MANGKLFKHGNRGTGSTLDAGNLGALAFMWKQLVNIDSPAFKQAQAFLGDKNETAVIMWKHDPEMLKMMRNWTQVTNIINKALLERVQELQEIMEAAKEQPTDGRSVGMNPAFEAPYDAVANHASDVIRSIEKLCLEQPTGPEAV
jgi:hypothetical protein